MLIITAYIKQILLKHHLEKLGKFSTVLYCF